MSLEYGILRDKLGPDINFDVILLAPVNDGIHIGQIMIIDEDVDFLNETVPNEGGCLIWQESLRC